VQPHLTAENRRGRVAAELEIFILHPSEFGVILLLRKHNAMLMPRICLFPGTFDPVTLGHIDIIDRAIPLFDKIYVGIGINSAKNPMFSAEQRMEWFKEIYKNEPRVESVVYDGLTVNYCREIGATFILRGIRYVSDFEYEKTIADANRTLDKNIETIFLTGEPKYTSVASTIVRDIIRNGGDASLFLPEAVNLSLQHQQKIS
jgi:pantetheine-phosphate adenylyltransferase